MVRCDFAYPFNACFWTCIFNRNCERVGCGKSQVCFSEAWVFAVELTKFTTESIKVLSQVSQTEIDFGALDTQTTAQGMFMKMTSLLLMMSTLVIILFNYPKIKRFLHLFYCIFGICIKFQALKKKSIPQFSVFLKLLTLKDVVIFA